MKRIILGMFLSLSTVTILFASDYRGAETIRVGVGDTLDQDLFAGGRYVDIFGTVRGDVFAGCQTVTVEGEVTQDVLVGCQHLIIRGKVGDGVIAFAGSVLITGDVHGDVLFFGGELRITDGATIHGNLLAYGGELFVDGNINGYIKGDCGRASLNANVGEYVELETEEISFGSEYRAGGVTKLTLKKELDEDEVENLPANLEITVKERDRFFESGFFYWCFFSMLVVGIIFISLLKNFSHDYVTFAGENGWKSLGLGVVFLIAIPIAISVLCVLIITIPVGLIVLAVFLILLYLSAMFSSLYVGKYVLGLLQKNGNSKILILPLIVGLILVFLLAEVPYLGVLIEIAIICFGLGSFITYVWSLKKLNGSRIQAA